MRTVDHRPIPFYPASMHTESAPTRTPSGGTLRTVRRARGLSLREVSRRAKIDQAHLSRIERGERGASIETLYRLGKVLGLTELTQLLQPYVSERAS